MRLIRQKKVPEVIKAALDDPNYPSHFKLPFGTRGRSYYRAYFEVGAVGGIEEFSFAMEHEGEIFALVECDNTLGILGRFGLPIEPRIKSHLPYEIRSQAATEILAELKLIASNNHLETISIVSTAQLDPDGLILGALISQGAEPQIILRAESDLSLPNPLLFADLRKGHRQGVRWGCKHLTLSFVDRSTPDRNAFERFCSFYSDVAGRKTQNSNSWDENYRAITEGHGDLILGSLNRELVSGALILDAYDTGYYSLGASHRSHFDEPLAHAIVFTALLRAKSRNLRAFDLGEIYRLELGATKKEVAIGHFKSGFTSRTVSGIRVSWSIADSKENNM
jgi:hypothetical protein